MHRRHIIGNVTKPQQCCKKDDHLQMFNTYSHKCNCWTCGTSVSCWFHHRVKHNKDEMLHVQDFRLQKMRDPPQVTAYIKEQQRMALAGARGRQPDKALLGFYASMEHLCSVAGPLLDHISLSAIITATAQLWTSAQANTSFKPSADKTKSGLMHLYLGTLLQLKPMLPDVEARQISNILWSSAKLGLNPDAFVPGMTDALGAKLFQVTKGAARRQSNAQEDANFLWALATLGHEPADKGLIDAVCNHFAMLIKHHDDSKRPNAQEAANAVWAIATLSHELADKGLVDVVCNHFAMLIKHHDDSKQPMHKKLPMLCGLLPPWAISLQTRA